MAERALRRENTQVVIPTQHPPQTDDEPANIVTEGNHARHEHNNYFLSDVPEKNRPKQESREELIQRLLRDKRDRDARKQNIVVGNEPRNTIRSSTPDSLDGLKVSEQRPLVKNDDPRPRPTSVPRQRAVVFRDADVYAGAAVRDFQSPRLSTGPVGSLMAETKASGVASTASIRARPSSAPRERPLALAGSGGSGGSGPGEFRPSSAAVPNRHRREAVKREREAQIRRDFPFRPKINAEFDGGVVHQVYECCA